MTSDKSLPFSDAQVPHLGMAGGEGGDGGRGAKDLAGHQKPLLKLRLQGPASGSSDLVSPRGGLGVSTLPSLLVDPMLAREHNRNCSKDKNFHGTIGFIQLSR